MSCKYCRKNTHIIDNCPEILCKNCKKYGHPHWKCKKNPIEKNFDKKNSLRNANINTNTKNKEMVITDNNIKDLYEIKKYIDLKWSELCFV